MDFVNEQKNVLWFCDECIEQLETMKDNRISSNEIVAGVSESIKDSLTEMKNELMETKALTKSLAAKISSNDVTSNQARVAWPSIKRSREATSARETPRSRPKVKLVVGIKSVEK